jgi:hypothetical protein
MKSYVRATTGMAIGTMAADHNNPITSEVIIDEKVPRFSPRSKERRR